MKKGTMSIIDKLKLNDGLYPLTLSTPNPNSYHVNSAKKNNSIDERHRKLGHLIPNRLNKLSELNSSIPTFDRELIKQHQCVPCLVGRAKRSYIPSSSRNTTRHLELIHLDISGPVESSLEGYRYTVVIVDDFTAASFGKTLKKKSELSQALGEFKHRAGLELQTYGIKLTSIRLERAGENFPNTVKEFCSDNGIHLEPSTACAPQSNGCAERFIQEHRIRARVLLFSSNLPKYLWPEAVNHANWLRNRLSAPRIDNEIPIMR